jgi:hypothetical protein
MIDKKIIVERISLALRWASNQPIAARAIKGITRPPGTLNVESPFFDLNLIIARDNNKKTCKT